VKDSLFRDLGRGVSLVVLPSYLQNKGVMTKFKKRSI